MEKIEVKSRPYITIKEAQEYIVNQSPGWYLDKIKTGKIIASSEGRGSNYLILTESLLSYLEGLQQ